MQMNKKTILIIGQVILLAGILCSQTSRGFQIISVAKTPQNAGKLRGFNLDFLMEWDQRIYIHASLDDLNRLKKMNIPYVDETHKFISRREQEVSLQSGVNGAYHSYRELERDLMTLEESFPEIARVAVLGQTLERRNIYAVKISDNVHSDENEASVIFTGCHHAREWISVEVPYLLAKHLVQNYQNDPQIQRLVDETEIWIVPLLNPDGLEYSIHYYRYWRKNLRDNGDGTYGVDLNRNYSYKWGIDNSGSSPHSYSDVYRGKSPFSELETQAIQDLFAKNAFQALISYHSYSQIILYPWGYMFAPTEKDDLLSFLAGEMSARMRAVNGRFYAFGIAASSLYVTNGGMTDWAFGVYGIPSFTIELPPVDQIRGAFFNAEDDIPSIFNENLPAALFIIDWAIQTHQPEKASLRQSEVRSRNRIQKHKHP